MSLERTKALVRELLDNPAGLRALADELERDGSPALRPTQRTRVRNRKLDRDEPCVYFIKACFSGAVKIGFSHDAKKRLATLRTGHPEPLRLLAFVNGSQALERALHKEFERFCIHGEWFGLQPEIRERARTLFDERGGWWGRWR